MKTLENTSYLVSNSYKKEDEVKTLEETTEKQIWTYELDEFQGVYEKIVKEYLTKKTSGTNKKTSKGKKRKVIKKKK